MEDVECPEQVRSQWEVAALDVAYEHVQDDEAEVVRHSLESDEWLKLLRCELVGAHRADNHCAEEKAEHRRNTHLLLTLSPCISSL